MAGSLYLPYDIPWKLIAASPDMMDTDFCDETFPYRWRSSLAISAFEPKVEDIAEEMGDVRISYLKLTCSITGYQPDSDEIEEGLASMPDVPIEEVEEALSEYYGCYGVLINIGVHPSGDSMEEIESTTIAFSGYDAGSSLPNPFPFGGASIEAQSGTNTIVDQYPPGGDGSGELDLGTEISVTLPNAVRVEAEVVVTADAVTMDVYGGSALIATEISGIEQGVIHTLEAEGEGIDRIVLRAPAGGASLLSLTYETERSVTIELHDYPYIASLEPKTRDLYQAATDEGEILTSSSSELITNKSLTNTRATQTDLGLDATVRFGADTADVQTVLGSSLDHSWGKSESDNWTVETDASRERREVQGTTTQLSQLYNLLTGYHAGTNRAVFLMLPRPHILQSTDRRSFVRGLRVIEGVQEFFLVVVRPAGIPGLCIDAALDTAHFPEEVKIVEPKEEFETSSEEFLATAVASQQGGSNRDEKTFQELHTVQVGWVIDRSKGDSGHSGMEELSNLSNDQADKTLIGYSYGALNDSTAQVRGTINSSGLLGSDDSRGDAEFKRKYKVYTRSEQPKESDAVSHARVGELLITSRGLCVCFASGDVHPSVTRPPSSFTGPKKGTWIADEREIRIASSVLTASATKNSRTPAAKELTRKIQGALVASRSQNRRRQPGAIRFLDTDTFAGRIRKVMPQEQLKKPVPLDDLPVSTRPGRARPTEPPSVDTVLGTPLRQLSRSLGVSEEAAASLRRRALGRPEVVAPAAPTTPTLRDDPTAVRNDPPPKPKVKPGPPPRRGGGRRGGGR